MSFVWPLASGASWEQIHNASSYVDYVVVAAVAALAAWLLVRRLRRRRVTEESAQ